MSTDPDRLEHRHERRGAQRFEVQLPLAVHFEGRTVPGFTQDLSGRGIFFYAETSAERMLPEGAVVELTFTMPSEITLAETWPCDAGDGCCGLRLPRMAILRQVSGMGSLCNSIPTSTYRPTSLRLNSCGFRLPVWPQRFRGSCRAEPYLSAFNVLGLSGPAVCAVLPHLFKR